jgi:hypothetical protein
LVEVDVEGTVEVHFLSEIGEVSSTNLEVEVRG